ncbi:hypothetical protein BASA83_009541 [Batrachochytrium salamandrivorans]|nr:hypothetical protein BASA83_009541 [Batrachochytrium salamandrivorans]
MRIERFVETNNLLSYEQAGFRKREECVGQVVSLVDIIQRRQNAGLNTHVLFIDIRKALIQSQITIGPIPSTEGCQTGMSIVWTTVQSVHQRHSRWCRTHHSPWTTARHNPIRGLMYADDVAVFADSEQSLLAASTAIEQWANQWEMQFGVAKCGIISFTGHLAPRLDNPLDIRLHGQLVSRVESYKYLGVLIDSKLDHSAWLKQKRLLWAELVGGNKSHLAPLQTTINKGIRLFTGARLSTAIGPLLVETGIGSLLTRSLVSRVRLLERSVTKRTPINAICSGTDNDVFTLNVQGQLVRSQRWFWSRRTKQLYRNRYWLTPQSDQRQSSNALVCIDGDSTNMWRLCIAPKLLSTSIAHLVVECEQVAGHRISVWIVPAIQKSRLRLLGRALDRAVENVYTWLRAVWCFTHRIREDGEVFSSEEGRATSSDTTPLASVAGSCRMRSTDSDRSVRATPKKARDASPPPQDDLWVVVKNLSQQVAAPQAEMDALRKHYCSPAEGKQQPGENPWQHGKSDGLVERQPEFRKAGAAAWLALKRETSVPAHSAPKWSSPRVSDSFMQAGSLREAWRLRKAMQGARIRTSASGRDYSQSFKAWFPRSEAAEKDKLAAISSFAVKTVTTIQRSPDVKARNFFRSLLASIGGKTLEVATAEAAKIRVQTPGLTYPHWR